jgi:hypothetical protein
MSQGFEVDFWPSMCPQPREIGLIHMEGIKKRVAEKTNIYELSYVHYVVFQWT